MTYQAIRSVCPKYLSFVLATTTWLVAWQITAAETPDTRPATVSVGPSDLPPLPMELTSFGGAVSGGKIFLYGGHTGDAHSYSTTEQSNQLWMLDLQNPKQWTALATGPRLQGLALVAYQDTVIRLGGFTAINEKGETHDLRSQTSVSRYDVKNDAWINLQPLPEPRSSFDAAVLGDTVYVIGGWELAGEDTLWHKTAWSLDLSNPNAKWQPLETPPFQRRALWVAQHQGKIHVIGGMDANDGPSARTDVFDPQTNRWTQGPSLQGPPMTGFGCSAHSLDRKLYVSTIRGNIQQLADDGQSWKVLTRFQPGRFFHCMVPTTDKTFALIGGANMSIGKFTRIDSVTVTESAER